MRVETGLSGTFDAPSGGPVLTRIDEFAAAARKIEELGFDGAAMAEVGHDPFLPLVIAAEHTQRIYLVPNVAIAFPRSPMVTAQMAWALQRYSGGRFRLGIGSQVKANNVRRYSTPWPAPPGRRLREYVLCLRAIFQSFQSSEPSYFHGQYYQFTMLQPAFNPGPIEHPHIPIEIGGVSPYMAHLAGELCDGFRPPGWVTSQYFKEVLLPSLEAGAHKAGRQLSDIELVGGGAIVTGKNEREVEAAKKQIKQLISFFGSTPSYHKVFAVHGWLDVGQKLHRMSQEGKWEEMPGLISDDMVEEFAVVGTHDEIVRKLKKRWDGVCTTLGLPHQTSEGDERVRAMIQELHQP